MPDNVNFSLKFQIMETKNLIINIRDYDNVIFQTIMDNRHLIVHFEKEPNCL